MALGGIFGHIKKWITTRGPVNFNKPENYDLIIDYAESDRSTYENIRTNKPDIKLVKTALDEFLSNCKFYKTYPNEGYIKALGFK